MSREILEEQIQYYCDRAGEYDQWFFRQGRYFRGEEHKQQWFAEVGEVKTTLETIQPSGDILEIACGTGLWTQHLANFATHLTAVDASPEVIGINQQRVNSVNVEYMVADIFTWKPSKQFDFIFFGFWLSHVPDYLFAPFWDVVKQALKPGGRVFFVDSLFNQESTARNHINLNKQGYAERKLNDGRSYRVVKIFHEPGQLESKLLSWGWLGNVSWTKNYFLYGLFSLHGLS